MRKKARLEVLLDDAYWPAFSTVRARSTNVDWQYIGEGFIKELDFGRVWLRLNEADEGDKDQIIAEYKGEAKDFLKQTLVSPPFPVMNRRETHSSPSKEPRGSPSWTRTTKRRRLWWRLRHAMCRCPSSWSPARV